MVSNGLRSPRTIEPESVLLLPVAQRKEIVGTGKPNSPNLEPSLPEWARSFFLARERITFTPSCGLSMSCLTTRRRRIMMPSGIILVASVWSDGRSFSSRSRVGAAPAIGCKLKSRPGWVSDAARISGVLRVATPRIQIFEPSARF